MKAVQLTRFGGPEVLQIADVPKPEPAPTEVLVRVEAVGLNPVEQWVRGGQFPWDGTLPLVPGWDLCGVVESVVPGVTRFVEGDRVFGMPFFPRPARAYAEYVAAPSRQLAKAPRSLDAAHAAALPLAGLTAWQSLVDVAQVQGGQRVLVHAAAGGVGHLAVQIAKGLGAWVCATASAGKHDFVKRLGADEVIDYRSRDFSAAVSDIDVVIESVGGDYADRSLRVLRPGGLLVTLVQRTDAALQARTLAAGRRFAGVTVEPDGPALETLARWVDEGRLKVHVDASYPLAEAAKAHARLAGSLTGKIVLTT